MSTATAISTRCPKCGKNVKVASNAAGKRVRCPDPTCSATYSVPSTAGSSQVPGPTRQGMGVRGQVMLAVGGIFAVIAAVLTVRELNLETGWIVAIVLAGLLFLSEFLRGPLKAGLVAAFVLIGLSAPALFFLSAPRGARMAMLDTRLSSFYAGASVFFLLSAILVFRSYRSWSRFQWSDAAKLGTNLESIAVWSALILSSIAFSWVTYYAFFSVLGEEEFLVRRLVFTLFFVIVGVACTVAGKNVAIPFLAATGLTYMAAGVIKALAYDLGHTTGLIRIGVFAGCGAVLLLGGFLMMPARQQIAAEGEFAAVIED